MSLLSQFARTLVRKVTSDPKARAKFQQAASTVAREAGRIAKEDDRAYAAGKAFKRALNKLQDGK